MNADLIKSILSLVAASIPLLVALVASIRNLIKQNSSIIDSPSLKIYQIKREPFNRHFWKKYSDIFSQYIFIVTLMIIYQIVIFQLIQPSYLQSHAILLMFYYILAYIMGFFILIGVIKAFSPRISNYYYFKSAILVIEADYHYLFNKSHEVLRSMNFKVLDVDENAGTVLALIVPFYLIRARQIKICIEKHEGMQSRYNVRLEFLTKVNAFESSKVTNQFINQLISKPKNQDQKADSKIDTSTDVGD